MNSTTAYKLPEHLRSVLKKPLGYLVSGKDLIKEIRQFEIVISVGDHVSVSLVNDQVFPQLMIIDYRTKRRAISTHQKDIFQQLRDYKQQTIENPYIFNPVENLSL